MMDGTEPPLLFVINSGVNRFIRNREELWKTQIPLAAELHSFLSHNSYLALHEAITSFTCEDIENQILGDGKRILGEIRDLETRTQIETGVNVSPTLILGHKHRIHAALAQHIHNAN